jgi:hypothetical protein
MTSSFDGPHERRRREHAVERVDIGAEPQQNTHRLWVACHCRAMESRDPIPGHHVDERRHAAVNPFTSTPNARLRYNCVTPGIHL